MNFWGIKLFQFKENNKKIFTKEGYCGIGILQNKNVINMGLLLRTAAIYGNDFIFTIGGEPYSYQKADVTRSHLNIPTFHFETFDAFKSSIHPNCKIVAVEMTKKAKYLHEYSHPERCAYVLGSEDKGIPEHLIREFNDVVKLPGKVSLNVGIAGSLILYDRLIKRNEYQGLTE